MKPITTIFSENLKYQLERTETKQQALADFMGVSQSLVSDWAAGRKSPRLNKLDKICQFFGIGIGELMMERIGKDIGR